MFKQTLTRIYGALVVVLVLAGAIVAVAMASGSQSPTVRSASNATLKTNVVVNLQGRTLYALTPETSKHLLCKTKACLGFWPPLTVSSATTKLKAGPGVQGRLGLVRRGSKSFQVTLRGMPLYRFAGDRGRDESHGQGIESFGGRWHAATASSAASVQPKQPSSTGTSPAPAPTPYATSTPMPSAPATTTSTQTTATPPPTTTTTTTPTYTYPY
jgi:predicted lipoprotein with Yx(FWY)xxD motif